MRPALCPRGFDCVTLACDRESRPAIACSPHLSIPAVLSLGSFQDALNGTTNASYPRAPNGSTFCG